MGTAPEVTDIEQLAHRLCRLNRSAGGYKATGELLEIAREFHPDFQRLPLAYRNGKPGPDAVFVGSHPAHASTVVTAHYDTLGASGGCDNTSGVVAILLLAALVRTDRDGN